MSNFTELSLEVMTEI